MINNRYGEPRFPYVWEEIKRLIGTKSTVQVTPKSSSGTNIADIVIDGTTIPLYAPEGGSGGTTDYNDLTNKPSIKGVTLTGNKSFTNLGLYEDPDLVTITNTEITTLVTTTPNA
jgi:hypothetical protein